MASILGFAAAILVLSAPLQAQAPKPSNKTEASITPTVRFSIYGSVARPGTYQLKPGDRIENALRDAAGPALRADLGTIMLTHASRSGGAVSMVWVNFNDFVLGGKPSGNPLLQPGDELYILSKGSRYKPSTSVIVN